ncbi:MAG TPA: DUF2927 domain-containing protein [Pseudolabrys sp.]|nr:DUF2927 domain-containing protein [Pseudolabrys sp.]
MKRTFAALVVLLSATATALAASNKQPAPPGAFSGAPPQYTVFSTAELMRGFLALSVGSDLRVGAAPRGIRRFDRPIRAAVIASGSVDRTTAMRQVLGDFAAQVPSLRLSETDDAATADVEVRLIDERDIAPALEAAFGTRIARTFINRTNPQCVTSVKSSPGGRILHSISFIIVDKGNKVFFDCAYHELLHAFGLSNHDQRNPWTTLNQRRMVGYLSVYDRALLTLLYDPRVTPGMTLSQTRRRLPAVIKDLGLSGSPDGR